MDILLLSLRLCVDDLRCHDVLAWQAKRLAVVLEVGTGATLSVRLGANKVVLCAVAVADNPGVWATGDRLNGASIGDGLRAFESACKPASL